MATRTLIALVLLVSFAPRARAEILRPTKSESLERVVARAREGDVVEVPPGTWRANLRIERTITLRGAGGVIDGGGEGQVR